MVCKIGIVGFGVVGKSFAALAAAEIEKFGLVLNKPHCEFVFSVWDGRTLTDEEQALAASINAIVADSGSVTLEQFIAGNDYVCVSPGIDIYPFRSMWHKCLGELDFFAKLFAKKTIAITGSVGKTTTTKLLTNLISALQPDSITLSGGNIGRGMLELASGAVACDTAVLELSSFQLDLNRSFAPDIALWTNFYPNHLDRHHSPEAYFEAKAKLFLRQQPHQYALLAAELFDEPSGVWARGMVEGLKSNLIICSTQPAHHDVLLSIPCKHFDLFWLENDSLFKASVCDGIIQKKTAICSLTALPDVTFKQNWVFIMATLDLYGLNPADVEKISHDAPVWDLENHHRVEHCATIGGVDFYDDSKSTMIQATQAAVEKFACARRPIILILGGLGKGVDRSPLMHWLAYNKSVKQVLCFGKECSALAGAHQIFATLEQTIDYIFSSMKSGDIVLFSPSGTSFDLFKNYEHRGQVFQELVKQRMVG